MGLTFSNSNGTSGRFRAYTTFLSSDPDVSAFLSATGITDATISSAVSTLVTDLKGYNIWSKMKALYPFVGGTAITNKYNLANPSLYQITWFGGVTHSFNGITGNGTNGYGDTGLANNLMLQNDLHFSIYSRTNTSVNGADIGAWDSGFGSGLYSRTAALNFNLASNTNTQVFEPVADSLGLYLGTRTTSNQVIIQKNTTQYIKSSNTSNLVTTTWKVLRPGELNSEYSPRNISFASIGDGLTSTQALNLYTAVQAFQTTLGRQV